MRKIGFFNYVSFLAASAILGIVASAGLIFLTKPYPVQVQNNLTCPHCREVVKQGSVFCPHCGQPLTEQFHCPSCGKVVDKEARFCQFCGASLKRVCPACHAELEPGAKFCSKCGKKCDEC